MIEMKYTALVTIAATLFTLFVSLRVGGLRPKLKIKAPATTGDERFERAYRVHYNTIEQLVIFLPPLWLAVSVLGDRWTGAIGAIWIVGRLIYSRAYMADPGSRGPGIIVTMLPTAVLTGAVLWGVVKAFM